MVKRLPPPAEFGRRPGDTEQVEMEVGWAESDGAAVALLMVLDVDNPVGLIAPKSSNRPAVTYEDSFAMEGGTDEDSPGRVLNALAEAVRVLL